MNKISRNATCPCGSGRKYKKCCDVNEQSHLDGLTPGIRMKGGVRYDGLAGGYIPIVHTWDNVDCQGEPAEWCSPKVFPTDDGAMEYYKQHIRPALQRMMAEMENKTSYGTMIHHELE